MGKIRVKTIGDDEQEAKEALKSQKRAEAKLAKKGEEVKAPQEEKFAKPTPTTDKNSKTKSAAYQKAAALIDKQKLYTLKDALELLPKLGMAKFDETVELHLNTFSTGISGNMQLPHGTGKTLRVAIVSEDLITEIEKGNLSFDILLAEPTMMPKLAKVAKILGPRGLMPNPKNGTVTQKPEEAAKKFAGGQVNFKTEAKFPLLHLSVGKVSFGEEKLADNIKAAVAAVTKKNIKNATLKSTMSPGIRINLATL